MGRPLSLRDSLPGLGRLTRRFWPYVRRERPLIMVSLLALYAEIVLRLLEPWPLKWVLDRVAGVTRHRGFSRLPFLDALDPATLLALSAVAATAAESIGAVKVIHALSLEGTFAQAFTGQSRKNLATGVRATRLSAGLERTVDLLIAVATAAVLWYGARLALRGVMTPGDLVVFLAYLKNAFRPVRDFVKYTGRLAKASAAGERVLDLLDRTPAVRALQGAGPAPARLANAHAFVEALPKGYDTMVGERGVTLSNGQRQRIAIARAAIRRAPVLILDEPTTGLDGENERAVIEALERLAEGRTTFLITHDLLLAGRADLVLYLEAGRVREWGTHAQLLQAGGQYALLYHLQTAGGGRGTTPQRYDAVTT